MAAELRRAEALGIPYVVTHPGAYTSGTEQAGIENVIRAINEIHARLGDIRGASACWKPRPARAPRWAGSSDSWPKSLTA